jgi:hypothetical protein
VKRGLVLSLSHSLSLLDDKIKEKSPSIFKRPLLHGRV